MHRGRVPHLLHQSTDGGGVVSGQTCDCGHCLDAGYIALLNAAHDIYCKGCGWCGYTGRAQMLELTR